MRFSDIYEIRHLLGFVCSLQLPSRHRTRLEGIVHDLRELVKELERDHEAQQQAHPANHPPIHDSRSGPRHPGH